MDLSVIIVNWNSANYIRGCLKSIYSETTDLKFEIIIIDNASYDGCNEIIKKEFPEVKFIQSKENVGFAKANNLGFKYSNGHALLFLNPDTEIIGPAIGLLYSYLLSLPAAGAVGGRLLNSDYSLQTSCIQPYPTILNQLLDFEYLIRLSPKLKLWGMRPLFCSNTGSPEEVEVISGACIMVKREVFEKIGHFSHDYFMYAEDVDLCYKINQSGYKNYYVSGAAIIHHGGGSTKNEHENYLTIVLMRESIFRFIKKTQGRLNALLYKFAMMTAAFVRLILVMLVLPWKVLSRRPQKLNNIYCKWKRVLRWSIGFEETK